MSERADTNKTTVAEAADSYARPDDLLAGTILLEDDLDGVAGGGGASGGVLDR
jgi:hypothetical protein